MKVTRKEGRKMQVTSIELPEELYRDVKHRAVDESTSFRAVVQKALQEYMERAKKGGRKK